jgi:nitrite reductase (NADH) small subunit
MSGHWMLVGRMEEIPRLGARKLCTPNGPVAVFRTSDDRVFALADRCPHRGGPLSEGIVSGHNVTCPLHNWIIDLETGRACAPDDGQVASVAAKVEDGMVFVELSAFTGKSAA